MSDQPVDQTTFVESVELRDESQPASTHPAHSEVVVEEQNTAPTVTKKKNRLPFLVISGILFFILLLVVLYSLPRTNRGNSPAHPTASDSPSIGKPLPSELQKSIDAMSTTIQDSDPSNNDLPFPPVNFQLHLVPPQPTINQ